MTKARERWLKMRRAGLGGSEIAAVAGLDPHRTAIDVYNRKLELVPEEPDVPIMRRGKALEPHVIDEYGAATGRTIRRWPQTKLLRHPTRLWQIATPDAEIEVVDAVGARPGLHARPGLLEAKTHRHAVYEEAKREGLPSRFIAQLQWALGTGGYEWGAYAIFWPDGWELLHFDVVFDATLFGALTEIGERFIVDYLKPRVPPPIPEAPLVLVNPIAHDAPTVPLHGPDAERALSMYFEAHRNATDAKSALELAKEHLRGLLGSGHAVYANPRATVRFDHKPGKRTLSRDAIVSHEPLDGALVRHLLAPEGALGDKPGALIEAVFASCRLDLGKCENVGEPYEQLNVYPRKSALK